MHEKGYRNREGSGAPNRACGAGEGERWRPPGGPSPLYFRCLNSETAGFETPYLCLTEGPAQSTSFDAPRRLRSAAIPSLLHGKLGTDGVGSI